MLPASDFLQWGPQSSVFNAWHKVNTHYLSVGLNCPSSKALKHRLCSLGHRMTSLKGFTLRCQDNNDQYFKIWRTAMLASLRQPEINLISGSGGIKMFYKMKDLS